MTQGDLIRVNRAKDRPIAAPPQKAPKRSVATARRPQKVSRNRKETP